MVFTGDLLTLAYTTTLGVLLAGAKAASAQVRPRKDHRGVDLISDVLPVGRLRYGEPNALICGRILE